MQITGLFMFGVCFFFFQPLYEYLFYVISMVFLVTDKFVAILVTMLL